MLIHNIHIANEEGEIEREKDSQKRFAKILKQQRGLRDLKEILERPERATETAPQSKNSDGDSDLMEPGVCGKRAHFFPLIFIPFC